MGKSTDEKSHQWIASNVGKHAQNKKLTDICAIITRGSNDFSTITREGKHTAYSITKSTNVKKTTGAGDTFTGTLCSMLLKNEPISKTLSYASVASKMTV